jgi:hypothetical protein
MNIDVFLHIGKKKKGALFVVKLWILGFLLGCFAERINYIGNFVGKTVMSLFFILFFIVILLLYIEKILLLVKFIGKLLIERFL